MDGVPHSALRTMYTVVFVAAQNVIMGPFISFHMRSPTRNDGRDGKLHHGEPARYRTALLAEVMNENPEAPPVWLIAPQPPHGVHAGDAGAAAYVPVAQTTGWALFPAQLKPAPQTVHVAVLPAQAEVVDVDA